MLLLNQGSRVEMKSYDAQRVAKNQKSCNRSTDMSTVVCLHHRPHGRSIARSSRLRAGLHLRPVTMTAEF